MSDTSVLTQKAGAEADADSRGTGPLIGLLLAAAVAWGGVYALNEVLWDWLFAAVGLNTDVAFWGALHFFLYDTCKVLLLLVGMIFAIGLLRTSLRPETVRAYLQDKPLAISLLLAAILGSITPFCSCSSIPLFIGFVAAGVPVAVTLTFLLASPLVNEVAVIMLGESFGWSITIAYVLSGLGLAILLGFVFSRLDLEDQVHDFVRSSPTAQLHANGTRPTLAQRVTAAREETGEIFGRVWKWVILGVAAGAVIHGWVPAAVMAKYAGPDNPFAVVVATVLGVPLYSNAAGVIPIAQALWAKGVATGTVLTMMMATVALSFPEFILLKQVIKPKLLGLYFSSVAIGIMAIGLLFNAFA